MRIAVTGASGFTGSHTVPLLISGGHAVRCLVRRADAAAELMDLGCEVVLGDLENTDALRNAFSGCDCLINVASLGFGHADLVVRAAEKAGVRRAVFVSTTGIFTQLNPRSKAVRLAAEETVRGSCLRWTIVRPTMIYGTARDRNISRLIRFIRISPVLPVFGGGHALMQPVHVDDLATGLMRSVESTAAVGRSYNLSGALPIRYNDLVRTVARLMNRRILLWHLPHAPAVGILRRTENLGMKLPIKAEQILRLQEDKAFAWDDAGRDFGFSPCTFEAGVRTELAGMGRLAKLPP